jgi:phosphoribosylanthranilate isomerase
MTFIKICGITNLADALAAVDAGADALGFNFYPPSARYIAPAAARQIIERLPPPILSVGVFVNEATAETVKVIAAEAGVAALQLHGDESPGYCAELKGWYVIKTLAVGETFDARRPLDYEVQAIMLDASDKQFRGGTGQVIDWSIARRVRELGPRIFLAGGLSSENVQEAIATVEPYAVDACSSLEAVPGKKNHDRICAFIAAARAGGG